MTTGRFPPSAAAVSGVHPLYAPYTRTRHTLRGQPHLPRAINEVNELTTQRTHLVNRILARARSKHSRDHREVPVLYCRCPQRGPPILRAIHAHTSHNHTCRARRSWWNHPAARTPRKLPPCSRPQQAEPSPHCGARAPPPPSTGFPHPARHTRAHVTHTGGNHTCGAPSSGWNHPAARTPRQPPPCSRPQRVEL